MARLQLANRPTTSGKHPKAQKAGRPSKTVTLNAGSTPRAKSKSKPKAPTAKALKVPHAVAADGDENLAPITEAAATAEPVAPKKRKHSRMFRFRQRVMRAQRANKPIINKQAGYRILKWAKDQIDLPGAATIRFKPSAIRAFHQAAEQITLEIFDDAYHSTLNARMSELQPGQVESALRVWSRYNGGNLTDDFYDLMSQIGTPTQI